MWVDYPGRMDEHTARLAAGGASLEERTVFFYDSECGMCDRFVQFLLERTEAGSLYFSSLRSPFAQTVLSAWRVDSRAAEAAYLLRGRHLYKGNSAIVEALRLTRSSSGFVLCLAMIPAPVRALGYSLVARYRRLLSARAGSCRVLTPIEKSRFVTDLEAMVSAP
jgi:predicted DCC family thiol-disulfide oxidoreductase YuxK